MHCDVMALIGSSSNFTKDVADSQYLSRSFLPTSEIHKKKTFFYHVHASYANRGVVRLYTQCVNHPQQRFQIKDPINIEVIITRLHFISCVWTVSALQKNPELFP